MAISLEPHVFGVLENHLKLQTFLGEHSWLFDMDAGQIKFISPDRRSILAQCPVQILGTFSLASETWLWGWANLKSGIPSNLVRFGRRLQDVGKKENKPEYYQDTSFELVRENQGQEMAIVACGLAGLFTFYYCETGESGLFFGIESCEEAAKIPRTPMLAESVLTSGISNFEFQHQPAVEAYLGPPQSKQGNLWEWKIGKDPFRVTFDQQGRIAQIFAKN